MENQALNHYKRNKAEILDRQKYYQEHQQEFTVVVKHITTKNMLGSNIIKHHQKPLKYNKVV
jgi:hypothetical protein